MAGVWFSFVLSECIVTFITIFFASTEEKDSNEEIDENLPEEFS